LNCRDIQTIKAEKDNEDEVTSVGPTILEAFDAGANVFEDMNWQIAPFSS